MICTIIAIIVSAGAAAAIWAGLTRRSLIKAGRRAAERNPAGHDREFRFIWQEKAFWKGFLSEVSRQSLEEEYIETD